MTRTNYKEIWHPVTDPERIEAIKNGPKYRHYWKMVGDVMWLLKGEHTGKTL
jgi:hypothetical protein